MDDICMWVFCTMQNFFRTGAKDSKDTIQLARLICMTFSWLLMKFLRIIATFRLYHPLQQLASLNRCHFSRCRQFCFCHVINTNLVCIVSCRKQNGMSIVSTILHSNNSDFFSCAELISMLIPTRNHSHFWFLQTHKRITDWTQGQIQTTAVPTQASRKGESGSLGWVPRGRTKASAALAHMLAIAMAFHVFLFIYLFANLNKWKTTNKTKFIPGCLTNQEDMCMSIMLYVVAMAAFVLVVMYVLPLANVKLVDNILSKEFGILFLYATGGYVALSLIWYVVRCLCSTAECCLRCRSSPNQSS